MLEDSPGYKRVEKGFKNPLISLIYLLALIFSLISLGAISSLSWFLPDFVFGYSLDKNAFYYLLSYSNRIISSTASILIVVFPFYMILLFLVNEIEIKNPFYRYNFFRKVFVILPIVLAVLFLTGYSIYVVYKILSFDDVFELVDFVRYLLQLVVLMPVILYHTKLLRNKNLDMNKN